MDLYVDPTGHVWDIGPFGRRYITHPDVVHTFTSTGRTVGHISVAALATIPRLPDTGLPSWMLTGMVPVAGPVDVEALAEQLAGALGTDLAGQVANELGRRLSS